MTITVREVARRLGLPASASKAAVEEARAAQANRPTRPGALAPTATSEGTGWCSHGRHG